MEKNRMLYFDILKLTAAFAVVWIHFGNEIHWYDGSLAWKMCVPIQVLAYWAVPIYFMITGATLMNYRERYGTKIFFRRRIIRGIAPYLVWGTIMLFLDRKRIFVDGSGVAANMGLVLDCYINNKMEPVYWFFIPLFSVYLSIPILSLLTQKQNREILKYALIVGTILVSFLPFSYNLFYNIFKPESNFYWNSLLTLPVLGGYTLYCVLGYWAATHDFTKKQRCVCYLLGIFGAIVRFSGLWFLSQRDGETSKIFMDYLSWPALTLALAVFVLFRYLPWDKHIGEKTQKVMAYLASCGLGVYVMHSLVIRKMGTLLIFHKYSFAWYYLLPLPTFLVCLLMVAVVKKIPFIRRIFP
mgnify:FL=1